MSPTRLRIVLAVAKRSLIEGVRYPFEMAFFAVMPVFWAMPYVFQGLALVGEPTSKIFAEFAGTPDYISFIVVGSIFFSYAASAIWGMGNFFRWEQENGTLEALFTTPASRIDIALGVALSEASISILFTLVQLGICSALFNIGFMVERLLPTFLVMILLLIALYGFSLLFASAILVFKDPGVLSELSFAILNVLTPTRYPTTVNPVTRLLSLAIPLTYGVIALRALLLIGKPLSAIINELSSLLFLDVSLWLLGYMIFSYADRKVRKGGTLGKF